MDKETILKNAQNESDEYRIQVDLKAKQLLAVIVTLYIALLKPALDISNLIKEFTIRADMVSHILLLGISVGWAAESFYKYAHLKERVQLTIAILCSATAVITVLNIILGLLV